MPVFGFRKKRFSRVLPLKPAGSFLDAIRQPVANRSVWLRLGMCGVALAALVICLRAWQSPVPVSDRRFYRSRDHRPRRFQTGRPLQHRPGPGRRRGPNAAHLPQRSRAAAALAGQAARQSARDRRRQVAQGCFGKDAGRIRTDGRRAGWSCQSARPAARRGICHPASACSRPESGRPEIRSNRSSKSSKTSPRSCGCAGLADVDQFAAHKIGGDQSLAIVPAKSEVPSDVSPQEIVFPADVQLSELLKESGLSASRGSSTRA